MLLITREAIEGYSNYPILLIDDLTKDYIVSNLLNIVDFSELDEKFGGIHKREDKIHNLKGVVHIRGYEVGTQHSPNNIYISIYLSHIHSKYKDYSIDYYAEARVFDDTYDNIKDELEKYLQFFNEEFNKLLFNLDKFNESK